MFSFICCKATEAKHDTEVLVGRAKGAIQGAANDFTQARLRDALVGEPVNQVHEAPDIYVVITEVILQDGVKFKGVNDFVLRGVDCKVLVKIQGTRSQMAGMVAAKQAGRLFDFMAQGEKALTGALGVSGAGLAQRVSASTAEAAAGLAGSAATGEDFTELQFSVVLDIEKVSGVEEVKATVTSITSDADAINTVMSLDMMKTYVETAIAVRASRAVTDWHKGTFTLDGAKAQGGVLVASGLSKGGELVEAGRAKGSELASTVKVGELLETGKAKGNELLETGKAKGSEFVEVGKAKGSELTDIVKAKAGKQ